MDAPGVLANFFIAKWREAQGDKRAALAAVRRRVYNWLTMHVTAIPAQLRLEGRLAAEIGDTAGAIRAYEDYLRLRDALDTEEMTRQVQQVRAHLAQLAAKTFAQR